MSHNPISRQWLQLSRPRIAKRDFNRTPRKRHKNLDGRADRHKNDAGETSRILSRLLRRRDGPSILSQEIFHRPYIFRVTKNQLAKNLGGPKVRLGFGGT